MMRRFMQMAELFKTETEQLSFGSREIEIKIADIETAIFEKNFLSYKNNEINGVEYDYVAFSDFPKLESGEYITFKNYRFKINYVGHSKKYNIAYLERVI